MIEINRTPGARELNVFGALLAVFGLVVGGIVYWRTGSWRAAGSAWAVAGALVAVYFAAPGARRPIYLGWVYAAYPIGWTISMCVMALTYYGVITPIGLAMRLVGYDPLKRRLDPAAESYWIARPENRDVRRYFRQF